MKDLMETANAISLMARTATEGTPCEGMPASLEVTELCLISINDNLSELVDQLKYIYDEIERANRLKAAELCNDSVEEIEKIMEV